jgi:hypothetical protein
MGRFRPAECCLTPSEPIADEWTRTGRNATLPVGAETGIRNVPHVCQVVG